MDDLEEARAEVRSLACDDALGLEQPVEGAHLCDGRVLLEVHEACGALLGCVLAGSVEGLEERLPGLGRRCPRCSRARQLGRHELVQSAVDAAGPLRGIGELALELA